MMQNFTSPPPIFQHRAEAFSTTTPLVRLFLNCNSVVDYARAYASYGFYVFPVHSVRNGRCSCGRECRSPGKHPRVKRGFKDATTDHTQIESWWKRWPDANVAIATGAVSGLLVLDIDGLAGLAKLKALIAENELLPRTLVVKTARGFHIWLRMPDNGKSIPSRTFNGLDVRGDGGYVVAPPSVHASGHVYRFYEPDDVG